MAIIHPGMTTTQFDLHGYEIVRTLGMVRGIIVRSRSIFGTIGASLQTLVGGNITLLTNLCERTRQEALDLMLQHAAQLNANAVVGCAMTPQKSCRASPRCWHTEQQSWCSQRVIEPEFRRSREPGVPGTRGACVLGSEPDHAAGGCDKRRRI